MPLWPLLSFYLKEIKLDYLTYAHIKMSEISLVFSVNETSFAEIIPGYDLFPLLWLLVALETPCK